MAITDIPLLSMLRTRMHWQQDRQRVLADNVSNSDTPGFRPQDLTPLKLQDPPAVAQQPVSNVTLTRTEAGHIEGVGLSAASGFRSENKPDYEVRPTGNAVSLEEEMMKVASNQMDFQAATALYSRSLGLIKTALGKG